MSQFLSDLMKNFLSGEHAIRHQPGWWNAIWLNMMVETSVIRFSHRPHGIIGITLNKKTLESLALSLHATTQLEQGFLNLKKDRPLLLTSHKEEGKGQITRDSEDRKSI